MGFGYHGQMENTPPPVTFDSDPAPGTVNFGIGQPSPDLMPTALLRRASDAFLAASAPLDLNYGERQGSAGFRSALAEFLSEQYGSPTGAETLFVTAGNSQALDFVCGQFANAGDTVFIEEPSYFLAHQIFADHGLRIVGIPMDRGGMCMDALRQELTRHSPALLYTIPSYHNPCGVTMEEERRREVARLSRKHGFVIAADEVYQMLHYSETPPPAFGTLLADGNILSLGSFSKIMAPALRLGWIQASPDLMDRILATGVVNSGGSFNHFTSLVLQEAIESGQQSAWLESLQSVYAQRLSTMQQALEQHFDGLAEWETPKGGYFFWLRLAPGVETARLKPLAASYQTGFQPGGVFSCQDGFRNYIRLSFAHYTDPEIRDGVARLARLLRENGAGL